MLRAKSAKIRAGPKINVMGLIKRVREIDNPKAPRGRGRPTKEQERAKFGWAGVNPFKYKGGKFSPAVQPISIIKMIRNLKPAPVAPKQPFSPEQIAKTRQIGQEQRFIAGKAAEAQEFLKSGALMPSSVVEELIYDYDTNAVYVQLGDRKYTYANVPSRVFDRWWKGQASCITTDGGKFTGRHRKQWIRGKTPSLGAFYNKYIKGRYSMTEGW